MQVARVAGDDGVLGQAREVARDRRLWRTRCRSAGGRGARRARTISTTPASAAPVRGAATCAGSTARRRSRRRRRTSSATASRAPRLGRREREHVDRERGRSRPGRRAARTSAGAGRGPAATRSTSGRSATADGDRAEGDQRIRVAVREVEPEEDGLRDRAGAERDDRQREHLGAQQPQVRRAARAAAQARRRTRMLPGGPQVEPAAVLAQVLERATARRSAATRARRTRGTRAPRPP